MTAIDRLRTLLLGSMSALFGLCALASAADEHAFAPLPPECVAAAAEKPTFAAFPFLVDAMTKRHRIVALAMGSSVVGDDYRSGDYYDLVDHFLESSFKGLDVEIVQRGVSGELARDAAERLRLDVARFSPDVVFWQVGTADGLAGIDPAEVAETVGDTVRWLHEHRIDVVLIGLHYSQSLRDDPRYQSVREAIDRVAQAEGVLRIRRYEVGETLDKLQPDRLVPRPPEDRAALDDACMAEYLARALATGIFGRKAPAATDH